MVDTRYAVTERGLTVAISAVALNEHKNGTLKTMNRRDFLFMVILLMVAWPLLVMDRATRGEG